MVQFIKIYISIFFHYFHNFCSSNLRKSSNEPSRGMKRDGKSGTGYVPHCTSSQGMRRWCALFFVAKRVRRTQGTSIPGLLFVLYNIHIPDTSRLFQPSLNPASHAWINIGSACISPAIPPNEINSVSHPILFVLSFQKPYHSTPPPQRSSSQLIVKISRLVFTLNITQNVYIADREKSKQCMTAFDGVIPEWRFEIHKHNRSGYKIDPLRSILLSILSEYIWINVTAIDGPFNFLSFKKPFAIIDSNWSNIKIFWTV